MVASRLWTVLLGILQTVAHLEFQKWLCLSPTTKLNRHRIVVHTKKTKLWQLAQIAGIVLEAVQTPYEMEEASITLRSKRQA
jgi:hypothetical protein